MSTLYDKDLCAWSEEQAGFLIKREWDRLDVENVAKEIRSLAHLEVMRLEGIICLWMQCMLKLKYYSEKTDEVRAWDLLAYSARATANDILSDNPSLLNTVEESFKELYVHAFTMVALEFDGWLYINDRMPKKCRFTLKDLLETNKENKDESR